MIKFKTAQESDVLLLQQLAHTIWHSHYPGIISVAQIEYMLNMMYTPNVILKEINAGYNWVLIFDGVQPIGFLSFVVEKESNSVKLNKLYILTTYHGKGYGNQSLEYVKLFCNEQKISKLYLTVNKQNTKAIDAYVRAGFYKEREAVADIGNGYVMDDYIMAFDF